MGMGEVHKLGLLSAIAPQGLGKIYHHVASILPWTEDAHLGVALRIDRSIEKADPRMTPAGIGQDLDPPPGISSRLAGGTRRQGIE